MKQGLFLINFLQYCSQHLYQDIDTNEIVDDDVVDSFNEVNTDDYETIEEIKASNFQCEEVKSENLIEWRVLSRLEGDVGEDWRIVDTLPRFKNKQETYWQQKEVLCDKFKETCKINEEPQCKHLSIMCTNNVNNVASDSGCEQQINANGFLEKLLASNSQDSYQNDESEATRHLGRYL